MAPFDDTGHDETGKDSQNKTMIDDDDRTFFYFAPWAYAFVYQEGGQGQ